LARGSAGRLAERAALPGRGGRLLPAGCRV